MKLLVVHDKARDEVGGMSAFIAAQNALLRSAGWQVSELICTPQPQPDALHQPSSGRRLGRHALAQLQGIVQTERPDAVLLHSVYYALGPWALRGLSSSVPLTYVLHDVTPLCPRQTRLDRDGRICDRPQGVGCVTGGCWRPGEQGRWASDAHGLLMRALQARAMRSVPHWIVPSRYLAELLQRHGTAEADTVAVLPHFLEPADPPSQPPVPGRLLFVGRLVPEKGLQVLLDALPHLQAAGWHLHVAGDGPSRAAAQAQVQRLGLAERVHWLGTLSSPALAAQYAQATAVIMPSLIPESFGLVGLEAMRGARPVVGFLSGGMAEWLRDGVNGVVAQWGDARSLAGAIDGLLRQPSVAAAMGARGRELLLDEFSPALHLQRLQRLLEHSIDAHGQPADRMAPPRPADTRAAQP